MYVSSCLRSQSDAVDAGEAADILCISCRVGIVGSSSVGMLPCPSHSTLSRGLYVSAKLWVENVVRGPNMMFIAWPMCRRRILYPSVRGTVAVEYMRLRSAFSTATDVSSILFSRGLATFYGEETGGGYYGNTSGITTTVTLPNTGFRLRLPLIRYETNVREIFPIGSGVVPHYPISETVESLRSEEDELLNYVIKTIKR